MNDYKKDSCFSLQGNGKFRGFRFPFQWIPTPHRPGNNMKQPYEKAVHLDNVYYDYEIDLETYDPLCEEFDLRDTSFYAVEEDGCLYYHCDHTKIKIQEHFVDHGKTMGDLLENVIRYAAKNTA